MKRMSDKVTNKEHRLTRNQRKFLVISVLVLIVIGIIVGIANFVKSLMPVDNITTETIDIEFSTKEIVAENVKITLSTTTKYDIYYYIDLKNEETADEIIANTVSNDTTNNIEESVKNTIVSNTITTPKINNSDYKKYKNGIIVSNNATIYLKYARDENFSNSAYSFEVNNIDKQGPDIGEIETSATNSTITVKVSATDNHSSNLNYYFRLEDDTEFISTENENTYKFENLEKNKTYTIYVLVSDELGNESEAVTDCEVTVQEVAAVKQKYYIKVNISANTVTIYSKDDNGEYTKPVKAMVCSCGKATPTSGKYNISYKYRWLALFGNVYGQYSTRIVGHILFHSVPYYSTDPNTLEYEEYDKLGTKASAGCIRLTVQDAKWIYDNVASGSTVEFYSDSNNPGPLGKPTAQKISNNEYRDWDPTDPDPRNPWHGGSGQVISTKPSIKDDDKENTNTVTNTVTNEVSNEISNTVTNAVTNTISNTTSNTVTNNVVNTTSNTTSNTITNTTSNTVSNTTNQVSNTITNNVANTTSNTVKNEVNNSTSNTTNTTNTVTNDVVNEPIWGTND